VILDSTTKTLEKFDNELLPLYYSLLESIIGGMIDESFKLEYSELASVRTAMAETYLAVAAFLAERWDMYLETSNLQVLDNITTIFSMGSYSNWVAEENSVDVEELERLTPLVITICQKKYLKLSRFECIDFDPFELCQEILPLLTADPESSKLFMQESGDVMVIDKIKDITDHSVLLTLYAVLLNIVVSSDSTTLEMKHSVYGVIMPQLISTIESKVDLVVKAHAIVLFLFLYRSSRKYKKDKVPIDAIFEFISKRKKKFPSAANELWYLIVLCI
jgi:hypothetical protein